MRIEQLGGAELGDKTMVDALVPFDAEFTRRVALGAGIPDGDEGCRGGGRRRGQATAALAARRGRARPLAERSVGHPDPGAMSFAIIVAALAAHDSKES